ncbi:MAG TPA: flagellar hook-associated protein FlgL [Solirubrobacteraceae bacterium]|nr:flagellar hook-associated protein FlgL [Solirubrobacteraceae bacterium]
MLGRITPSMISSSTLNDINSALASLERSSAELSSGKKILEPSDDPYGTSRAIDLQSQLDGLTSYTSSVQDGIAWTQAATGAMGNISDITQRVRELLLQAANGTLNAGDLNSIGVEVTQLTEAVKQDANTQYAGQFVFSGTLTTTAPYRSGPEDEFQGNTESVSRAIGPGTTLEVSTNLSSVLGNGGGSGDGKLLDVLRTIAQHLTEGTPASRAELASTDLKNLDTNMEALISLQANTGSATAQLRNAATRIETLEGALSRALSNTRDADIAQVSIAYSNEQAAYTAALRSGANIVQESLLNFLRE